MDLDRFSVEYVAWFPRKTMFTDQAITQPDVTTWFPGTVLYQN